MDKIQYLEDMKMRLKKDLSDDYSDETDVKEVGIMLNLIFSFESAIQNLINLGGKDNE